MRVVLLGWVALCGLAYVSSAAAVEPSARLPVILDTDIGDDIDDTWALAMLLKSPQLELKLVTTTYGKAVYRAKIIAKMLTVAGRSDIPIGLGEGGRDGSGGQQDWVKDYQLSQYPGKIHEDAAGAIIDLIQRSGQPVGVISDRPDAHPGRGRPAQPGRRRQGDVFRHGWERPQRVRRRKAGAGMERRAKHGGGAGRLCRPVAEHGDHSPGHLRRGGRRRRGSRR